MTVPLLFALLLAGCYTYAPSSIETLSRGDEVRARLTAAQFDELEEHLPGGDRVIEGEVVEADGNGMLLEVPITTVVEGIRVESLNQRLEIPASGVTDVELRSLDRPRTWAVTGVAAALVGYVIWDQLISDTRRGGTDPPPPPEEDRRTILKIPLIVW